MDTQEADRVNQISNFFVRVGLSAKEAAQMISNAYFFNGEPIPDTMKNRAVLHKRAVERRKKAKRGGKR